MENSFAMYAVVGSMLTREVFEEMTEMVELGRAVITKKE